MTQFPQFKAQTSMTQRAASRMLMLTAAFTLTVLPTVMPQPGWSYPETSLDAVTPQPTGDRPNAAALGQPLETNCQPSANPSQAKPAFCGKIGADGPSPKPKISNRLKLTSPLCQIVFSNGDWKTTCFIFQF